MKSAPRDLIIRISESVKSTLQSDLVSRGELRQITESNLEEGMDLVTCMENVVAHLLAEDVQIGYAVNTDGNYVKFIAWNGNVGERIARAHREVESCKGSNRDFVFWLCLSSNVDEYEAT